MCARFELGRGPRECLRQRKSPELVKSSLGAICLVTEIWIRMGWKAGVLDGNPVDYIRGWLVETILRKIVFDWDESELTNLDEICSPAMIEQGVAAIMAQAKGAISIKTKKVRERRRRSPKVRSQRKVADLDSGIRLQNRLLIIPIQKRR